MDGRSYSLASKSTMFTCSFIKVIKLEKITVQSTKSIPRQKKLVLKIKLYFPFHYCTLLLAYPISNKHQPKIS